MIPTTKTKLAKEFAHKVDHHGGDQHHYAILRKVGGSVVSGAMQAVVAHLVAKKLDKRVKRRVGRAILWAAWLEAQ